MANKQKPKFHDFADDVVGYRFAARIGRNRAIPFARNPLPLGCCLFGYQYRCTLASGKLHNP
jgi:hypothetical protein